MTFNQTFDERFGFDQADFNEGQPGDQDLGANKGVGELIGTLAPDRMAYGALAAPSFLEEDSDLYDLGVLAPGNYTIDVQNFDWGNTSTFGSVRRTSLSNDNIDANGFGETILGAGKIDFTVSEAANYLLRLTGRSGENAQYTVNFYEEGTILRNNEAIFNPFVFQTDLQVGDFPFVTLRANDPDGRSQPGEIEYFLDGESFITLPSSEIFFIQQEHVGKFLTVRFSFVDDGNTREVSDFFSVGQVIGQPNREAFFGFGSPLLLVEAGDTVTQGLSIFDEDGTENADFETDWFVDGELFFEGDDFTVPESAIGKELTFVVSFTDDRGFFEENEPVSAGLVLEPTNPLDIIRDLDPDFPGSPDSPPFPTTDVDFTLTKAESFSLLTMPDAFNLSLSGFGDFFGIGNSNANKIVGNSGANRLEGLGAADELRGLAGDDTIDGDDGEDRLFGNGGADRMKGGAGDDLLRGAGGDDTLIGNAGEDRLFAGGGDDFVKGGGGGDTIKSAGGADRVKAGGGGDFVNGGGGGDDLNGGGGADTLLGARGDDDLKGGGGADVFQFKNGDGADTILDFRQGQDRIEILSGANDFGDLDISQSGADVIISFGRNEITVETDNANAFTDADFVF